MSGGSLTPYALADTIKAAKANGFDVVRSDSITLLCDLDTPESQKQFTRVLPIIQEHFGAGAPVFWNSKNGRTHAMVPLYDPLSVEVRFALQAALGSDGVREALNMAQLAEGCTEPSLLFKPVVTE